MEKALGCIDKECQNGVSGNHMESIATPSGIDTTQWVMSVSAHDVKKVVSLYRTKFGKDGCGCLNTSMNVGSVSWDWECSCNNCGSKAKSLTPNEYVRRLEAHMKNGKTSLIFASEQFRASFRIVSHIVSEHKVCIDTELEGFFTHIVVFGTTFSLIKIDFDLTPLIPLRQLLHRIYAIHDIRLIDSNEHKNETDDFYENSSDEEEVPDYNGEYSTGESSSDNDEGENMDIDD